LFDLDYSAVSQAAKRFEQKGKKDKEIERRKERVDRIAKKQLNVKCET
jgi:hypothetical protein